MEEKNQQVLDLQILQAKQAAEFAMTPVGQAVKQFEVTQRMAQMYSASTIVPDTYKNNIGNCAIAVDMAMRIGCNPITVMQNLYIVYGLPSFTSKYIIAAVNTCGKFFPLQYEFRGSEGTQSRACRCVSYNITDHERKRPIVGDWVSIEMAVKEGWFDKKGSKWKTMPELMLRYRAAAFWQRVHAPEVSMGLITKEEAEDIQDAEYVEIRDEKPVKHIGFAADGGPVAPKPENARPPVATAAPQPEPQPDPQPEAKPQTPDQFFA